MTCIGSSPEELSFVYVPTSKCPGTNTQNSFSCTDFNTDEPFSVYVQIFDNSQTLYDGVVSGGEVFTVDIPSGTTSLQITISTVNETGGLGTVLQLLTMSVQCREEDQLMLLDTFGSLQLTGFKNAEMGDQQVYTKVEITYTATNSGTFDANLLKATVTSPFSGRYEALSTNEIVQTAPSDTKTFTESFLLNLAASSGANYEFDFAVEGEGSLSGQVCNEESSFSIQVL